MVDLFKNYIEKRIKLIKLDVIEVTANIGSNLVSSFLILVFVMFILLMLSLALGFYLGNLYNNFSIGFGIVALIYFALFTLFLIFGKKNIDQKIKDIIVSSSMDEDDDNE